MCDQGLDRLPGPLREQVGGQEPLHRLGERVVVALRPGPQVPAAVGGGQGVQDGLDHGCALGGQVAADDPGAVQGGVQEQGPVQGRVVAVGVGRDGPGPDLRADLRQRPQVSPGAGRGDEDLLGLAAELGRDLPGPLGQLQRDGLGECLGAEPGQERLVVTGQGPDGHVLGGLRPGAPGPCAPARSAASSARRPGARPGRRTRPAAGPTPPRPPRRPAPSPAGRRPAPRPACSPRPGRPGSRPALCSFSSASAALAGIASVHIFCLTSPEVLFRQPVRRFRCCFLIKL